MIELHGKLSVKRLSGMVNLVHVKASDDMLQAKTVTPSTSQQVVTPDTGSGYTVLSRVTVEAVKLQNKTVKPGSAAQAVQADDGSTGLGIVTVEAAPLQEITAEIAAEIQHLVPDPGFYGFSGVTIKALPDAETAAFCESVELPAVPAEVAESYVVITEVTSGETTMYLLAAADSAFFYGPGSAIGQSYDKFMGSLGAGTTYYTTAEGTSWTKLDDLAAGSMVAEMAETSRVVYSNHDIYQVEDDGSGNLSVDILYYAKSGLYGVAVSDAYRIQRETMEDLGDQVNRLTGTAESMTPGRMTQKLEDLNIQLEEITVTATEEVQTITPSSGVYGFSKVIVEAVEDSGTSGGGGTGGEGGDSGDETYESAENVTFGNEYNEEVVNTGLYIYGVEPLTVKCHPVPSSAYGLLFKGSNFYAYYASDLPYSYTNMYTNLSGGKSKGPFYYYYFNEENPTWVEQGTHYYTSGIGSLVWTSHNITKNSDGSIYKTASLAPTPETTTVPVITPAEREETYTISSDTLNGLVGIAQHITGAQETMTPEEAISALKKYAGLSTEDETTE